MADFGLARFQDEGGAMTAETGTYRWMAPEVLLATATFICSIELKFKLEFLDFPLFQIDLES